MRKKFGKKINFEFKPYVDFGVKATYGSSKRSDKSNSQIVFVGCHLDYHRCKFSQTPALRSDARKDTMGDGYIRSAYIYTGYKIFIQIDVQSLHDQSDKRFKLGGKLSLFGKGLGGSFGGYFDSINDTMKDMCITQITMKSEGFGDYSTPAIQFSSLKTIDELNDAIDQIKLHYTQNVHRIAIRSFFLDYPSDVVSYPHERVFTHGSLGKQFQQQPSFKKFDNKFFNHLLDLIDCENDLSDKLGSDSGSFLKALYNTFINVLYQCDTVDQSGYNLIMGPSGIGKSTIVGFLGGADYTRGTSSYGEPEANPITHDSNLPKTGAFISTTKGGALYKDFIDAAGFFDTGGLAEELCNSMALSILTRHVSTRMIIVVVNASSFDIRCRTLTDTIEKIFKVTNKKSILEIVDSVLFLVNEKKEHMTQEIVNQKIGYAIRCYEEERNEMLDTDEEKEIIKTIYSQHQGQDVPSLMKNFNPKVGEYQERITLLERILNTKSALVIDIFNKKNREDILTAIKQKKPGYLSSHLQLYPENLIKNGSNTSGIF
ncbi:MAG: hypothetical protein ACSNEK_00120 [Parachlamydiaceae bacterium]